MGESVMVGMEQGRALMFLAVLVATETACFNGHGAGRSKQGNAGADEAVPVETVKATTGDLVDRLWSSATVESVSRVDVLAEVSGKVDRIAVQEGDRVKKRGLLCHLDNATVVNGHARAESTVKKLEHDLADLKKLAGKGAVSWKQVRDIEYQLEQARLNMDQMAWELEHTYVRSPIAGTVTERNVNLGEYVLPNRRLFTIVDLDDLVVKVHVPESKLPKLKPGLKARVRSDTLKAMFDAVVERINPVVDSSTGTVEVTLKVLPRSRDDPAKRLVPGMFVRVGIELGVKKGVIVVPKRAIVYEEGMPVLFVVEEGRARKVGPLDLGLSDKDHVEILSGLSVGDRVIVVGQAGLKDGTPVKQVESDESSGHAEVRSDHSVPDAGETGLKNTK